MFYTKLGSCICKLSTSIQPDHFAQFQTQNLRGFTAEFPMSTVKLSQISTLRQSVYNSFAGLFWMNDCNRCRKLDNGLSTSHFLFFIDLSFDLEFGKFLNFPFISIVTNFVHGRMAGQAKYRLCHRTLGAVYRERESRKNIVRKRRDDLSA